MSGQLGKFLRSDSAKDEAEEQAAVAEKPRAPAEAPRAAPQQTPGRAFGTVIGAGSRIEGTLVCDGPTRIAGKVEGAVQGDGLVAVDDGATVRADIVVTEAEISGKVYGNVSATTRVSLAPSAHIEGDIVTPRLSIADGALIKGKIDVSPDANRAGAARAPSAPPGSAQSGSAQTGSSGLFKDSPATRAAIFTDKPEPPAAE